MACFFFFDPAIVQKRVAEEAVGWWIMTEELEEVQSGDISIIGIGADGTYEVRVTTR